MSGSGSRGSSERVDVGSGGGSSQDRCGSLVVETTLNSPVAQVIRGVKVDDVLSVEIEVSPTRVKTLVAKTASGDIAGALTPPSLITIINCIEGGFEYEAVVLEKSAGLVRVRIQAKR